MTLRPALTVLTILSTALGSPALAQPGARGDRQGAAGGAAPAAAAPGAAADDKKDERAEEFTLVDQQAKTKVFTFDYGVPTSPALKLSGLSTENTTTSTALKPFVLSLPDLFNGDAAGQAVGFDFNPWAGLTPDYTWGEYRGLDPWRRALRRGRVGLVAYRGVVDTDASKNKASKLAIGLSTSLLDHNDPLMTHITNGLSYWEHCTDAAIEGYIPARAAANSSREQRDQAAYRAFQAERVKRAIQKDIDEGRDPTATIEANAEFIDSVIGSGFFTRRTSVGPIATAPEARVVPAASTEEAELKAAVATFKAAAARKHGEDREAWLALAAMAERLGKSESASATRRERAPGPTTPTAARDLPSPAEVVTRLDEQAKKLRGKVDELAPAAKTELAKDAGDAGFTAAADKCAKRSSAEAFSSPALDIGVGALWNGQAGKFKKFDNGGGAIWVGGKWPFHVERDKKDILGPYDEGLPLRAWVIGGSARYAWREDVATGDQTTPSFSADTLDLWGGIEVISQKTKFALQYGRFEADANDSTLSRFTRSGDRWLATAAMRVSDAKSGIWANLTYGVADGTTTTLKDETLKITISFGPVEGPELFK